MTDGWGRDSYGTSEWGGTESTGTVAPPSAGEVSPSKIARRGGDVVTLVGEHFTHDMSIEILSGNAIDGYVVEGTGYFFNPEFDITGSKALFGTPALPDGTYHLRVITDNGESILEDALTYELFAEELKTLRVRSGFASVWNTDRRLLTTNQAI